MRAQPYSRWVGLVLFCSSLGFFACSGENKASGVTNPQSPNHCLRVDERCALDVDCCSQSCKNNVCVKQQP